MAAALVGGALQSVQVLLDKIASREFLDFFRSRKLDASLLGKLKMTLRSLRAVLNDAEEKQFTNPDVKEWLDELTHAVFDADDLLDEINTEALRCKVEEANDQSQPFGGKVWDVISEQPYEVINSKIQILIETLQEFARQKDILQLKGVSSSVWHGTPTSSVVDESTIYGRDDEKKKIKEYLLSENASGTVSKIGVIVIVGMGGIGKTTLAKLLYNDREVKEKFDLKAWACAPKDFDVVRVTKTLLESVTSKATNTDNLNALQVELQQSLSRKIFLLVLDDIWGVSYVDWANLMPIFNTGEMGSKIIVTTRQESVAKVVQTFPTCDLTPLARKDCWSILAKHAFGGINCSERSDLEEIGEEIAKKCGGLPLAAVALGGLLRTKLSKDDWNKVLKSNIWDLPDLKVQPSLLLSYHFLPAPLKRCFAYCSIFPKNSILIKETTVRLWIAEGLVHVSKSEKSMEEVGGEYFDELVSRSLIRRRPEENFEMHDLINDLATIISSTYCIRYEDQKALENLNKIRYLSYNRGRYDSLNMFESFDGLKGLHTFLGLPLHGRRYWSPSYIPNKVVHDLLQELKQLRVLSLSQYENIIELPSSIGNLEHLRHLDLSGTRIKRLPAAICKLYNLQTLLLFRCERLTELAEEMGKLVNLRHLDISDTNIGRLPPTTCNLYNLRTLLLFNCRCLTELPEGMGKLVNLHHLDIIGTRLQEMPLQIARLENLQTLTGFVVSKHQNGLKVAELRKFPHLQGKLCISQLQNVIDPYDAFQANLKKKEQIEILSLEWGCHTTEDSQLLVLEHLQPSTNLKDLTIRSYSGTGFPNWLGDSSFDNMVYLCIDGCDRCSSLPPVGQLRSLKELRILDMISVKTVGSEFYGHTFPTFQPFPSLEILEFSDMPEWEEWNLMGGTATEFPRLSYLYLDNCPKFKGSLPSNCASLTELYLSDCSQLESRSSGEADDRDIMRPSSLLNQLSLGLSSLQDLHLCHIPSLTAFPRDGLPKTLRELNIRDCENIEFPTHESLRSYKALEELVILNSCYSLTSFPLGSLPMLKRLVLEKCRSLRSISISEEEDALQCLCMEALPAPNLKDFWVSCCPKLNSLPEPINTLAGLQGLRICSLPNLQSFAEEGLPISLQSLQLGNHEGIFSNTAITKWGLGRLTCLSMLEIEGDYLVKMLMEMEVPLLPSSLMSLCISYMHEIKHLEGKWLQHLTSLKSFDISLCYSLESLPEGLPSSLESLTILDCDRLKSLPEEGLPSSLSVLTIQRCPLLKDSCRSNGGREWPKIARIPCIIIDEEAII